MKRFYSPAAAREAVFITSANAIIFSDEVAGLSSVGEGRKGIVTRKDVVCARKNPPVEKAKSNEATSSPKREPPTSVTQSLIDSTVLHPEISPVRK